MRYFRYNIRRFKDNEFHSDETIFSGKRPTDYIYELKKFDYDERKRLSEVWQKEFAKEVAKQREDPKYYPMHVPKPDWYTYEITVHEITAQAFEDREQYSEPLKEYHFYA